jgi:hypothetical protein
MESARLQLGVDTRKFIETCLAKLGLVSSAHDGRGEIKTAHRGSDAPNKPECGPGAH